MSVDRGNTQDQTELLKDEIGQVRADCAQRQEARWKSAHRSRRRATESSAARENPRVIVGVEIGDCTFQRIHFVAEPVHVDLFENRLQEFHEEGVGATRECSGFRHHSGSCAHGGKGLRPDWSLFAASVKDASIRHFVPAFDSDLVDSDFDDEELEDSDFVDSDFPDSDLAESDFADSGLADSDLLSPDLLSLSLFDESEPDFSLPDELPSLPDFA